MPSNGHIILQRKQKTSPCQREREKERDNGDGDYHDRHDHDHRDHQDHHVKRSPLLHTLSFHHCQLEAHPSRAQLYTTSPKILPFPQNFYTSTQHYRNSITLHILFKTLPYFPPNFRQTNKQTHISFEFENANSIKGIKNG